MADPTVSINIAVTPEGAQQTSPLTLWQRYIALVTAINPGYTVLPAGLIEDLSSTATYAIALMDSAACETINSLTPFSANPFILTELGAQFGIPRNATSRTSVYVRFASASIGYRIPQGFLVSDGTYTYSVQDGAVIEAGGISELVYCLATQDGSWAVPVGSVNELASSIPTGYSVTVSNPQAGTPGSGTQTEAEYAALVLAAQQLNAQGTQAKAKSVLTVVPNVQPRLVSIVPVGSLWKIICGGGDPYAVANAIYSSGIDVAALTGSTISIQSVTKANPGVATTNLNHGLVTGQSNVYIAGALGMTGINGGPYTVTVIDEKTFSFGADTTSFPDYISGGVVTPNNRNIVVSLFDAPDTYSIPFVNPPSQTVSVQLRWATISPNFISETAVAQYGIPAVVNYVNSIYVGQPLNLIALNQAFTNAVISLFNNDASLISELSWTISINGVETSPTGETSLVYGDPESSMNCTSADVTFTEI
jgi:hypothetical protein